MITPGSKPLIEDYSALAKVFQEPDTMFLLGHQAGDVATAAAGFSSPWKDLEVFFVKNVVDFALLIRAKLEAWNFFDGEAGQESSWTDPGFSATEPTFSAISSVKLPYSEAFTLLIAACAYNERKEKNPLQKVTLSSILTYWFNEFGELPEELEKLVKGHLPDAMKTLSDERFAVVYSLPKNTLFIRFDATVEMDKNYY